MRREPGLREEDVFLAITTLSFDIAGLELFLPLIIGARVVIAPRDITVDGPLLAKLIASLPGDRDAGDAGDLADVDRLGLAGRWAPENPLWR